MLSSLFILFADNVLLLLLMECLVAILLCEKKDYNFCNERDLEFKTSKCLRYNCKYLIFEKLNGNNRIENWGFETTVHCDCTDQELALCCTSQYIV